MLRLPKIEVEEDGECLSWDIIIEEILTRLPTKDLHTFKSVCKNWYQIISTPYFISHHLNTFNEGRIRVLVQKNCTTMIGYTNYSSEQEQIRYPPLISGKRFQVLGSCDGLLCLLFEQGGHKSIMVYNPSTGKYFNTHHCQDIQNNSAISFTWFGYHPTYKKYVLVWGQKMTGYSNNQVVVYKFSRKYSILKLIRSTSHGRPVHPRVPLSVVAYSCEQERGILLHGAVHWPAEWATNWSPWQSCHVISTYHLDGDKYSEILAPAVRQSVSKLGVRQGCLFAIFKPHKANVFEMWIMKEYGVEESWTKYANIMGFQDSFYLAPLGFFPNGDLILDTGTRKLVKYSFDDNKFVLLMNHNFGIYAEPIMCADSLMFPNHALFGDESSVLVN